MSYRPALFRIAELLRWDAVTASVAADALHPLPGHTWRPVCCLCVDSLEVALGGVDVDAYRVNLDSEHDTGCCSFCELGGVDTLVARISDEVFRRPPVGDYRWFRVAYPTANPHVPVTSDNQAVQ